MVKGKIKAKRKGINNEPSEAIKAKFASKVSKNVMEDLLNNLHTDEFQAKEVEVTVFFSAS